MAISQLMVSLLITWVLRVRSFGTILAIPIPVSGITEYTEFQFSKERSFIPKTEYSWGKFLENYYVFQPEARRPARATALNFPPKNSQKNAYSANSK